MEWVVDDFFEEASTEEPVVRLFIPSYRCLASHDGNTRPKNVLAILRERVEEKKHSVPE